jgi:hypothetical protein
MNAANADSILFPHIVLSETVTTILSVMNDDFDVSVLDELHYRYYYNSGSGACQEFDFWNPTSENDIVSFDMGAYFSGQDPQGVLFEPERVNAVYVDDFAALSRQGRTPTRGYVVVDNSPRNPTNPLPAPTAKLAGEAIIIEVSTGSAWGYQAYNASDIWGFAPPPAGPNNLGRLELLNPFDFSDRVETAGEVLVAPRTGLSAQEQKNYFWVPISIMPWDMIDSALFVTAVSSNMGPSGGYAASTSLKLRGTAEGADRIMFNRDERAYSGPGAATVTCVGRVDLETMVGEIVKQQTPQGGWTHLTVTAGEAIVFKGEINDVDTAGDLDLDGTYNNIYQLRKGFRESLGRPFVQTGAAGWTNLPTFAIPELDYNAPYAVWENIFSIPADVGARYNPANYADIDEVRAAVAAGNVFLGSGVQ